MSSVCIVFCMKCNELHRGRVITQCPSCRRTDVRCVFEPNPFLEDPALSRIPADCSQCHKRVQATFAVRCTSCNSDAVCLPDAVHVNQREDDCSWCHGKQKIVVDMLPCTHVCCVGCFGKYLETQFRVGKLYRVRGTQYVLVRCPDITCDVVMLPMTVLALMKKVSYAQFSAAAADGKVPWCEVRAVACPFGDCTSATQLSSSLHAEARCVRCTRKFCSECLSEWSVGHDCALVTQPPREVPKDTADRDVSAALLSQDEPFAPTLRSAKAKTSQSWQSLSRTFSASAITSRSRSLTKQKSADVVFPKQLPIVEPPIHEPARHVTMRLQSATRGAGLSRKPSFVDTAATFSLATTRESRSMRPCPRCSTRCTKKGPFNHVVCCNVEGHCNFQFCWVCMREWNPICAANHFIEEMS